GIDQTDSAYDPGSLTISHERVVIYRFRAAERAQGFARQATLHGEAPNPHAMPLPSVSNAIVEDSHHVVAAVYFDLAAKGRKKIHWVALVDVDTLSILYLEPFAAGLTGGAHATQTVKGQVFLVDPKTKSNGPDPGDQGQNAHALDQLRDLVDLPNLKATNPQK